MLYPILILAKIDLGVNSAKIKRNINFFESYPQKNKKTEPIFGPVLFLNNLLFIFNSFSS